VGGEEGAAGAGSLCLGAAASMVSPFLLRFVWSHLGNGNPHPASWAGKELVFFPFLRLRLSWAWKDAIFTPIFVCACFAIVSHSRVPCGH
jgi:hypothetical protein